MKKFEVFLVILAITGIALSLVVDSPELTVLLLVVSLGIVLLSYLFAGYFILRPKASIHFSKSILIAQGVFMAIGFYLVLGQLANPISFNTYLFLLGLPLVLIALFFLFQYVRKDQQEEKHFFLQLGIRSITVIALNLILIATPGQALAKMVYGQDSWLYARKMQKKYVWEYWEKRKDPPGKASLDRLEKALSYAKQRNDTSSHLYLSTLNGLGYVHYRMDDIDKGDSFQEKALSYFKTKNPSRVQENYGQRYKEAFFDGILNKGHIYYTKGIYSKADSFYRIALNYYEDDWTKAMIHDNFGTSNRERGNFQKADSFYRVSLTYHNQLNQPKYSSQINTMTNWASSQINQGGFQKADSILNSAQSIARAQFGKQDMEMARVLDILVDLKIEVAQYEKAKNYCLQSLKIKKEKQDKEGSDYLNSQVDLVSICRLQSQYQQADSLLQSCKSVISQKFESNKPIATRVYALLGELYTDLMEYEKGENFAKKAIKGRQDWFGEYSLMTAYAYHTYASVLYHSNRLKEADSLFDKALKIKRYEKGASSPEYALSLNDRSLVKIAQDSLDVATQYLKRCNSIYDEFFEEPHPRWGTHFLNKAYLKTEKEKYQKAEELLDQAMVNFKKVFDDEHLKIAKTYSQKADNQEEKGNIEQALQHYQNAQVIYQQILGEGHHHVQFLNSKMTNLQETLENDKNQPHSIKDSKKADINVVKLNSQKRNF